MILLVAFAITLASVPLCGGRLSRLGHLELRYSWLIVSALALQTLVISVFPEIGAGPGNAIHLGTYAMAAVFLVINRRLPGMPFLAFGSAANLAAIVANGGVMPASAWATQVSGLTSPGDEFANSRMVEDPHLLFLGDVFAIPDSWPFSNVFSIGDVALVIGGAILIHTTCETRLTRAGRARAAGRADAPAAVGAAVGQTASRSAR
jgi:Family of unknown function (DUF5317)